MHLVRRPSDFFSGLVFFLAGAFAIAIARNYPIGTLRVMGPGLYPLVVAGLLGLLGLFLLAKSVRGEGEEPIAIAPLPLVLVLAGIAVFGLILMQAGLLIAIVALVLIVSGASGRFRPVSSLILALGLAVGCVAVFVIGLGQRLPIFGAWFGS
jgi:hypothetical protein